MTTKGKKSLIERLYAGMVEAPNIEYPSSDGEPMAENEEQLYAMLDTITTLREWYAGREDAHVGGDLLIYYAMNDNESRIAPDVFVVFGSDKTLRPSWKVWEEGKAPDIVIELASGSTWRRDMREKRDIYALMEVTEYWRFDPAGSYFTPPLVGERLDDGEYAPLPVTLDDDGILRGHSGVLGLDFCVLSNGDLRLYDPDSGQWLRTYAESEAALREESAARRQAEEENRQLRERLRQLESGQ